MNCIRQPDSKLHQFTYHPETGIACQCISCMEWYRRVMASHARDWQLNENWAQHCGSSIYYERIVADNRMTIKRYLHKCFVALMGWPIQFNGVNHAR